MKNNLSQEWSELMKKAQSGDSVAYEKLLEDISSFLSLYLKKRIFNHDYIQDLIQEILLAIHKARHTFDITKPFFPWFLSIVNYKSIDYFNDQKKNNSVSFDDFLCEPETGTRFEDDIESKWMIESALSDLPLRYRELLKSVKLDGYSVKEASVLLGLSLSNVKTSIHRALKQLKENHI